MSEDAPAEKAEPVETWSDDGSADHRFRVVPAAYVILRRQRRDGSPEVLLQLREGTGFMDGHWAAGAAGHVEAGESVVEAAVREALEELGITIDATDLRPLTVMHRGERHGPALEQRVDVFFEASRWTGEPRRAEAAKSADLRWFPLDALPDPVVPHELRVLEALLAADMPRLMVHGF
ncbi:NUDIX hydrolase [Xylanimonas sp. McL0601]|uniref:NUDIX hydrolase n=1 Tax=Xylanimonas sp. McL0601 TaxID=3414739 RepID=UPI003CFA82C5